jgi:polar amino acid transport system substrate-binding protein
MTDQAVPGWTLPVVALALMVLAACTSQGGDPASVGRSAPAPGDVERVSAEPRGWSAEAYEDPVTSLAGCRPETLPTRVLGTLTLATIPNTRAPWVGTDLVIFPPIGEEFTPPPAPDPGDGEGYDAAVGYDLAERLGFDRDNVEWASEGFLTAVEPGAKDWDVYIAQTTILPERREDVDLSAPYYVMRQALVTVPDSPAADVDALEDLPDIRVAVLADTEAERLTRSFGFVLATAHEEDNDWRGQVGNRIADALITDFQSATELVERQRQRLIDATISAQLPLPEDPEEAYGMVLQKGSPLTPCVNTALTEMREDGTLAALEQEWLAEPYGWTILDGE